MYYLLWRNLQKLIYFRNHFGCSNSCFDFILLFPKTYYQPRLLTLSWFHATHSCLLLPYFKPFCIQFVANISYLNQDLVVDRVVFYYFLICYLAAPSLLEASSWGWIPKLGQVYQRDWEKKSCDAGFNALSQCASLLKRVLANFWKIDGVNIPFP